MSVAATSPTEFGAAPTSATPQAAETMPQVPAEPQQQAPPPDPFKYRLPTGSVYADEQALVNGAIEKDLTIERLKTQLAQIKLGGGAQPPQVPHSAQPGTNPAEEAIFRALKLRFPETREDDLRGWAAVQAEREAALENRAMERVTASVMVQEYNAIRAKDPRFDINVPGCGKEVFEDFPGLSPERHYRIWKAEQTERMSSAPATAPAHAAGNLYSRPFTNVGGAGGTTPQAPTEASDPYVVRAMENARAKGINDPARLAQIQQTAIDSLQFVNRGRR